MLIPKFQNEAFLDYTSYIFATAFIFWCSKYFFINKRFLKIPKPPFKHVFYNTVFMFFRIVSINWEQNRVAPYQEDVDFKTEQVKIEEHRKTRSYF